MQEPIKFAICEIVQSFPQGSNFDAHDVIKQLIQRYSDEYYTEYQEGEGHINFHKRLGKIIYNVVTSHHLAQHIGERESLNIVGNINSNAYYQKL